MIDFLRQEVLEKKKPLLGICLGMQILAQKGYEGGECPGLSLVEGEVKRFDLADKNAINHDGKKYDQIWMHKINY